MEALLFIESLVEVEYYQFDHLGWTTLTTVEIMSLSWGQQMLRRKVIDTTPTKLAKRLTSLDLIALGVGATLGAGVYVLTGTIGQTTGPATIICFMISGFASVLSGICYAVS